MTSIKTVRAQKFASNLEEVFEIVLMPVVNFHADQMLCAFRVIIVQHVFVLMVTLVIQMTSIWDVNSIHEFQNPYVQAIQIVCWDKFVWLAQMDLKNVSTHAIQLHAV